MSTLNPELIQELLKSFDVSSRNKGRRLFENMKRDFAFEKGVTEPGVYYAVYVPSESGNGHYDVSIDNQNDPLSTDCTCPAFERFGECKHIVAALHYIRDKESVPAPPKKSPLRIIRNKDEPANRINFQIRSLQQADVHQILSPEKRNRYIEIYRSYPKSKPGRVMQFTFGGLSNYRYTQKKVFTQQLEYLGNGEFTASCSCEKLASGLCEHLAAALLRTGNDHGYYYFRSFDDLSDERNALLAPFGINENDSMAKDFLFTIDRWNGKLVLTQKPDYYFGQGDAQKIAALSAAFRSKDGNSAPVVRPPLPAGAIVDYEAGILFNFISKKHIGYDIEPFMLREKKGNLDVKKINRDNAEGIAELKPLTDNLFEFITLFSQSRLLDLLEKYGSGYLRRFSNPWTQLPKGARDTLSEYYQKHVFENWDALAAYPHTYIMTEGKFSRNSVKPVRLSPQRLRLKFSVEKDDRFITVHLHVILNDLQADFSTARWFHYFLVSESTIAIPEKAEDVKIIGMFKAGKMIFPAGMKTEVMKNVLLPLREKYEVEMPPTLQWREVHAQPAPQLHLAEFQTQYLMLKIMFDYEGSLVEYDSVDFHIAENDDGVQYIHRNRAAEDGFKEFLRTLHPRFQNQLNNPYFYLPFNEVMVRGWFLNMTRQVQDAGYPVYGIENLKHFRYNSATPKFEIKAGSGIDWFDLEIEISWGDMKVSLKDVRKAILNKQQAVLLDDGSLGMIPEEWLQQFGAVLKVGEEENGTLRVSKKQLGVLDEISELLNNADVQEEIREKKERLLGVEKVKTSPPPKAVKAKFRPYQLSGYQWLQTLDDLGWGGCLADDMGLGKTLQVITFLRHLKEKHKNSTHLVVCPTSLIYNWQNEIEKFCPSLKYYIYYGIQRELGDSHFEEYDIILTSYSIARNDAERLRTFDWHYIVLDESHSIKNPDSLTARALCTLKSKNKIILSGTPVQNNTFDLYSQFNFINPGLLGNREFFKTEYANPIDKQGDKTASAQLRKIVYPFLLRRTKEQVATDLPDKTETILWCEMEAGQRSAYESYRKFYRDSLLRKIDEVGMNQAGIFILEALLRMRQICDHPALVKDKNFEKAPSVKIDELLRELQENTGSHKALVFSQFTEMLSQIRTAFDNEKISYCYLDGSTPAAKRREEVEHFQNDESVKVFLISLKAGGVGLNLTAADYVYIVDPWWNPAAEQQAIDRTHRIGQTRKIFAYKMICKDTVEEKILKLQERKKDISSELISEDAGFIKKLTRDDVSFLLS